MRGMCKQNKPKEEAEKEGANSFFEALLSNKRCLTLKSSEMNEAEDAQKSKIEQGREVQIQNQVTNT